MDEFSDHIDESYFTDELMPVKKVIKRISTINKARKFLLLQGAQMIHCMLQMLI